MSHPNCHSTCPLAIEYYSLEKTSRLYESYCDAPWICSIAKRVQKNAVSSAKPRKPLGNALHRFSWLRQLPKIRALETLARHHENDMRHRKISSTMDFSRFPAGRS